MNSIAIRDVVESDLQIICALNDEEVEHTSEMDLGRLNELNALSTYHRVCCVNGEVAGFLLAMKSGAPYVNDNFNWFASRYQSFIYIDRVVVSAKHRGMRVGSFLYRDLFQHATEHNVCIIACEFNIVPSNEPSRLFHESFGFKQQGTQWLANGKKQVSLQVAEI